MPSATSQTLTFSQRMYSIADRLRVGGWTHWRLLFCRSVPLCVGKLTERTELVHLALDTLGHIRFYCSHVLWVETFPQVDFLSSSSKMCWFPLDLIRSKSKLKNIVRKAANALQPNIWRSPFFLSHSQATFSDFLRQYIIHSLHG